MKKYIFIVIMIVIAIGLSLTFWFLNKDNLNYAEISLKVVGEGGYVEIVGEDNLKVTDEHTTKYEINGTAQYIITSNSGYHIKKIIIDNEVKLTSNDFKTSSVYNFEKLNGKHNIYVEFSRDLYISIEKTGVNGELSYLEPFAYEGQNAIVKIHPRKIGNTSSYFPITSIKIGDDFYSPEELMSNYSTSKYVLTKNSDEEYVLTLKDIKTNINVNVGFGMRLTFAFGADNKSSYSETLPNISYLSSSYESNVLTRSFVEGKRLIGWNYILYNDDTNKPSSSYRQILGTAREKVLGISNLGVKNIFLTAIYEDE